MMNNIKKLEHIVKLIIVNIIVFVVLLELIAAAIYFFNHKAFFYTHKRDAQPFAVPGSPADRQNAQLTDKRFHPFFGYTHKPAAKNTNNYGFYSPYDYPLKKEKENRYIIGIFGGSVANDFYREGRERLTAQLKRHAFFAGKEIIYLNYALGGYKQPQQMQILTYFLAIGQELDMALNIDGFNEVVFCSNNNRLNVDIAMPSAQHFLPMKDLMDSSTVTGEKLESMWKIHTLKKDLDRVNEKLIHTPLASLYLIYSSYGKYLYKKYRSRLVQFDTLIKPAKPGTGDSIVNIKYTPAVGDEPVLLAGVATLWYRTSFIMSRVMTGRGARYYHFLQPNQYYSEKTFSKEERETALDQQLAYNILVKKGYPVLQKAVEALQANHVNAFSAVGIFDSVKETVYIDKCCHFNRLGNQLFADFIADAITGKMSQD